MPVLGSRIDPRSERFAENRQAMLALVDAFREIEGRGRLEEESKRDRYAKRGQLLPRERVRHLLDRGSPWLELSTLCGYLQHDDKDGSLAGGNLIAGIGWVSGVRVMVSASNYVIKGGTMTPLGVEKGQRIQEIALEQKLPHVSLIESGGANLRYQAEMFIRGGRSFANQARLSAAGIPQIAVVHGSSTAGGAYIPGMSDHVIMVRRAARVFLAGPPLVHAATGEIADEESLGGAEMHATIAGTTEHVAQDDADAVRIAREVVSHLGWTSAASLRPFIEPAYDIDELCGAVPVDFRTPYDCREIIARIVDGSDFLEEKPDYDAHTICGRARISGMQVALIGNNGPISAEGAAKATHFIQAACQSGTPLVYLMNTTGFMVGTRSEQAGIVKHGAKMIQAVANATVPQVTLVVGGSFGAGNYGMCGRGLGPSFIFAWPDARTAVMGGEQAARVLDTVARHKLAREKRAATDVEEQLLARSHAQVVAQFEAESHAFWASAHLFDDGIIDPRDTRRVLQLTLETCLDARRRHLSSNTFGVARP